MPEAFDILEQQLGYAFENRALLTQALTHRSAEEGAVGHIRSYERMEFLGDSVLQLAVSRYIYEHRPDMPEGAMSRYRAGIVCEEALCRVAKALSLGALLRLGRGEINTGGREKPSILADVVEAIIGGIYLEAGFEAAEKVVIRLLKAQLEAPPQVTDPKTFLQEEVRRIFDQPVTYRIIREEGPPNQRIFTAEALMGEKVIGEGTGTRKKSAEQQAARMALASLRGVSAEEV